MYVITLVTIGLAFGALVLWRVWRSKQLCCVLTAMTAYGPQYSFRISHSSRWVEEIIEPRLSYGPCRMYLGSGGSEGNNWTLLERTEYLRDPLTGTREIYQRESDSLLAVVTTIGKYYNFYLLYPAARQDCLQDYENVLTSLEIHPIRVDIPSNQRSGAY
jgi:hypothetical protein